MADVAGYTRLMDLFEFDTHTRLMALFDQVIDPAISNGGQLVKSTGDGFLARFESVSNAFECAVTIQRQVHEREASQPRDRRISFRIGLHVGDIVVEQRDVYGAGVNLSARLEEIGEPGAVMISASVREQLGGNLKLPVFDLGNLALKNIKKPVRVFRVAAVPLPASVDDASSSRLMDRNPLITAFRGPAPSIAVLPFRNIANDPTQDYLTDAVTGDLAVDLSRLRDIVVISGATALTFKESNLDIRQIGRELGVRYLVVGSIGRTGDLVRTNVQLVAAASGEQLWGDRFENRFVDLGGLENAITGRIAASLNIQLVHAEGRRAERAPQPDALDLLLRATSLFYRSVTPENTLATRQLLQRSVVLDSSSALAWARLAHIIANDHLNHWNDANREQLRDAEEAVRRALLIDPSLALAHLASGLIQRARGAHHAALEAFGRAIELDRNFATAYAQKGNQFTLVGNPSEAQPLVEQAIRLSPYDPAIGIFNWFIGRANFFAGCYEQAIPWLRRSVETRPNVWYNRLYLVSAYARCDMKQAARRSLDEFYRHFPTRICNVADVVAMEGAEPNDEFAVVAARQKFHEGLLWAGMAER
ncbi:MAG: tetratricopeptide repeat protein [Alphaproteobacteria bacterium]|nr:tetratricopeptide repeat protein [Alphaproteobacteria bacterium]